MLIDKHNRPINYVRISVTDKCNLRCSYCMPEDMRFMAKDKLLTYEEILRLMSILVPHGIEKIRITGGEPFLRKDIMVLFEKLSQISGLKTIAVTTNGTETLPHLDRMLSMGIKKFNLSLDSLDRQRFANITKRDRYEEVSVCMHEMIASGIDLSINCVVMEGQNIEDIIPMVALTEDHPVSVRFIEEMPFNGNDGTYGSLAWDHIRIMEHIKSQFSKIEKLPDPLHSTSFNYRVEGHKGSFGLIPAFTRNFCGSCNRIRITPEGVLKTCLYDRGVFNLKNLIGSGADDTQILLAIQEAIAHKPKDGHEAEKDRIENKSFESMSTIGG